MKLQIKLTDDCVLVADTYWSDVKISVTSNEYKSWSATLDFHQAKKLCNWLDDWEYAQRKKCSSCQHERSGCQYHDGS